MSKETLPSLVSHASELIVKILEADGELTEFIENEMQVSQAALAEKVDSYKVIMEQLVVQKDYWRAKAQESTKIARAMENAKTSLNNNIKYAMQELDVGEMKGNDYRFKLSTLKPKLEINDEVLDDDYFIQVITLVPDKDRIFKALVDGEEVAGARLVESISLRSYVNKGK